MLFGQYGIVTRAKQAKTDMEQAKLNEEIALNEVEEYLENYGGTSNPTVEYAPYDNPYIPEGFTHIGTADWNSGYQIQETTTGNVFVWVPCVLNENQIKDGDNVQIFKKTLPTPKEDGTLDTADPYHKYNQDNLTITGEVESASAIKASVGKYGGFYIAAYEAGVPLDENKAEIASTSASATQKARSVKDATVWIDISRTNAIIAAENMVDSSSGVNSGLISAEAWDTTLGWMVNSSTNHASEPNKGYDIDSTGNGWYSDVSSKVKTTTGQYPINNIYDMAGNVWEWTTENCTYRGNSYLVDRGGDYFYSGSVYPAAYRGSTSDDAHFNVAFRVVLYK